MMATIICLIGFLFGYFVGKRLGSETGFAEGQALAPLLLRQKSLNQGYCALCQESQQQIKTSPHKAAPLKSYYVRQKKRGTS
ncbi:MAG: hypothetical protein P4N59_19060 [Negativicutes bacterium]|nr:hypothetical protein [Negativicutes bacterium]